MIQSGKLLGFAEPGDYQTESPKSVGLISYRQYSKIKLPCCFSSFATEPPQLMSLLLLLLLLVVVVVVVVVELVVVVVSN